MFPGCRANTVTKGGIMRLLHGVPTASAAVFLFVLVVSPSTPGPFARSARPLASQGAGTDAERCSALAAMDFESLPGAPTRVASARLVDVPPPDANAPRGRDRVSEPVARGTPTAVLA